MVGRRLADLVCSLLQQLLLVLCCLPLIASEPTLHSIHKPLPCNTCHVPQAKGSVVLKHPAHPQCMTCHADAFRQPTNTKVCAACHQSAEAPSASDLFPYPRYARQRPLLSEFSHARHVDRLGRMDARTGFRADCTFCHGFDEQGIFAEFPRHPQCAACHSKAGMHPVLSAASTTADCRACHVPEEIENPSPAARRHEIPAYVASGAWPDIRFSHVAHFRDRQRYGLNCSTCHYEVLASASLSSLTLPTMLDCVACHDASKTIRVQFRLSNCQACHIDRESGAAPATHTRDVRPAFHNESFRVHHEVEAAAPGAKCFVCHTNVAPSAAAKDQCISCHQVMRPASHSARWRDDIHGKYAAIDRQTCATCHVTDYCSRCHNELPRSHVPLPLFKNGQHAQLARLNERSCLTCHTFENTCLKCHVRNLR